MNATDEMQRTLWRYLHGELSAEERRQLEERLATEGDLAAERDRLETVWQGLELPPPQPVPLGFSDRIMARARERTRVTMPPWIRAASAAALAGGLLLGVGVGSLPMTPEDPAVAIETSTNAASTEASGLADDYWRMIEDFDSEQTSSGGLEG